ncbi:cytochrome P450 [Mycena latifolia]|nr:cytochrome P450 [Mycena latifolia]
MLFRLAIATIQTFGAYVLYRAIRFIYARLTSPLRHLQGPRSTNLMMGNILEVRNGATSGIEEHWVQQYGRTMRINGFFGAWGLYTMDTKALHHILFNTHIYPKPDPSRFNLGRIVGPGILVVEGDVHKQQNPAFGAPQIRELTGIFVQNTLREIWAADATQNGGVVRVEILSWLSKATLDIIGLAGFNYNINALGAQNQDTPDELATAFETLLATDNQFSALRFLQGLYPILRNISTEADRITRGAQATMMRIGRQLLAYSKRDIAETGTFETGRARDLLNLLVRANTSKEIPVNQQLSDEDVLAQVPTFLVAGHETTSTAVTWALFALTQNKAAQARVRAELLSLDTESPTMEELNALPYLDLRAALCDDIVPLAEPYTDAQGTVHENLRIPKGTTIFLPLLALNHAKEFIPERWESKESPIANAIPGVWGNMLTFLGGPRSCIGYRFALVEMKALLFTLIRDFEFELAVPISDVGTKMTSVTQGPILLSNMEAGLQMPLLVKPVVRS